MSGLLKTLKIPHCRRRRTRISIRFLAVAAFLVAPMVAQATDKPISHSTMALIADRALVDSAKLVREQGTTGLHVKLEEAYPIAVIRHDKLRAIYLIMMDYMQTSVLEATFPIGHDPYFNSRSFGIRIVPALDMIVPDTSAHTLFIMTLLKTEQDEEKRLGSSFSEIVEATQ